MAVRSQSTRVGAAPHVKWGLIAIASVVSFFLIVLPLAAIFAMALREGAALYAAKILEPETLHAIWLTVLTAIVVVPVNTAFGICAAWAVTKHRFPGQGLLIALIEIPYSVSPIVAGVAYLFLYGMQGLWGAWLQAQGVQIMFTIFAIFLVSLFVTSPFVARELISTMQGQGTDDEEASVSLGASGLRTFFLVTLPNIRWALLYGIILCNARVMGEFGAVSVVSGSIRGQTNTLPLQIELLFNDYNTTGAFAAATILTLLALVTLGLKLWLERESPTLRARH